MKQLLKKITKKAKESFFTYCLGLILSKEDKTCTKIAAFFGMSYDSLYRFLTKTYITTEDFQYFAFELANRYSKIGRGWLIIDDTNIIKKYSKVLPGFFDMYDIINHQYARGAQAVVVLWTNGKITIPLIFFWKFHKDLVKDDHKTKIKIAKKLLLECKGKVQFDYVLFDAHYSTIEMMIFAEKHNIKFVGKIAKNRKVRSLKGTYKMLYMHNTLRPLRNQRSRKLVASYGDLKLFFSLHKRKNKTHEYTYLFLVSNMNLHEKIYLKMYEQRWEIEKMFRTLKQLLGLSRCKSRSLEKQTTHIYATFFAYSFLQITKFSNTLKNPEQAARLLQELKFDEAILRITSFSENFQCFA